MSENKLFVKLTKPQLLNLEKILREGYIVYVFSVILFLIVGSFNFDEWGGFARLFDSVFTAAFVLCFFWYLFHMFVYAGTFLHI